MTLKFDVQPQSSAKKQPSQPRLLNALKKVPVTPATILVVEDDINVAAVMEARLESFGYNVCDIARTGLKAIEGQDHHRPDLVLMDILLEGDMNGIEAAEQISAKSDVPIIFITCLNDPSVLDKAIQTHPYGYLVKPYSFQHLVSTLEEQLHHSDRYR